MLGDVFAGQVRDRAARVAGQQVPGPVQAEHGVGLPVGHLRSGAVRARVHAQPPVVAPRLDHIADRDLVVVVKGEQRCPIDLSQPDELGADVVGEVGGVLVGAHNQ